MMRQSLLLSPSAGALGSQHVGHTQALCVFGRGRTGLQASLVEGAWREGAEMRQGEAFSVSGTDVRSFL